jgi:nucleoside-diphosphate-sugar epimerase
MEHAVRSEPYHVDYGGTLDFQYAPDVARLFIAAAGSGSTGARVLNVEGHVVPVAEFVDQVASVTGFDGIGVGVEPLPLPHSVASDGLGELVGAVAPTPLSAAIAETCQLFGR